MADFNLIPGYPLATGAAINGQADVDALKAAGITAVLDCQKERDDHLLLAPSGMAYLWDGRDDDGKNGPEMDPWWQAGLAFAVSVLTSLNLLHPATGRFLIPTHLLYTHCAAGCNRGPSMTYGILRAFYRLSPVAAEAVLRAARPQVTLAYIRDFDRYWDGHGQ